MMPVNQPKEFQCHRCGVTKDSKLNLLQHMRFYNDTRDFLCEFLYILGPLKMHIIFYHYEDYFEKFGSYLLGVTDECTEAVHSRYRLFEERHGYKCNLKRTPGHREKQHKSVIYFNSLNVGDE